MIISNASLHCLQHLQVEDLYAVLCVCLYMPVCLPHSDTFRTYIHTGAKSHSSELKIALRRRTIVMSTSQFLALVCVDKLCCHCLPNRATVDVLTSVNKTVLILSGAQILRNIPVFGRLILFFVGSGTSQLNFAYLFPTLQLENVLSRAFVLKENFLKNCFWMCKVRNK